MRNYLTRTSKSTDIIRILLIEDSAADARLFAELLTDCPADRFSLVRVERLGEAIVQFHANKFDVALLDLTLPDSSGLDSLDTLIERFPSLPIVVLTNTNDDELALDAVRYGAQDYLIKRRVNGELLVKSIRYAIERKQAAIDLQVQTDELAETNKLLAARNQELDRFCTIVSHDLKAPLRGISNLAQWIGDDLAATLEPGTRLNLTLMRSRVVRMETLIDGLLKYARVGSTATSLETFSIELLVAEIIDSLDLPDSFTIELPVDLALIKTNRVLLHQVLANLIENAYKHHPRPDGRIQVTAGLQATIWKFAVIDDGSGIALENQVRIFDLFQTLSSPERGNTGIGLSIVKKLVEAQGGNITLESELGMGTTFHFSWKAASMGSG